MELFKQQKAFDKGEFNWEVLEAKLHPKKLVKSKFEDDNPEAHILLTIS